MKRPITKAHIRNQIEDQIDDYLKQGGEVKQITRGISGRDNPDGPLKPGAEFQNSEKTERTFVPEVVAAIEARRKLKPQPKASKKPRPRKKVIYDDFGEPLRWEWVEE